MNGGPKEYVPHEVDRLKIYANPESVAWGLGTLFAAWNAAHRMGDAGRKSVAAAFTWDVIAEQTLDASYALPGMVRPEEPEIQLPEQGAWNLRQRPAEVPRKKRGRRGNLNGSAASAA